MPQSFLISSGAGKSLKNAPSPNATGAQYIHILAYFSLAVTVNNDLPPSPANNTVPYPHSFKEINADGLIFKEGSGAAIFRIVLRHPVAKEVKGKEQSFSGKWGDPRALQTFGL